MRCCLGLTCAPTPHPPDTQTRKNCSVGWGEQGFIKVEQMPEGTWGTCNMYYNMVRLIG